MLYGSQNTALGAHSDGYIRSLFTEYVVGKRISPDKIKCMLQSPLKPMHILSYLQAIHWTIFISAKVFTGCNRHITACIPVFNILRCINGWKTANILFCI